MFFSFVAKLSASGSSLIYVTGVPVRDIAAMAVDSTGAVYLTSSDAVLPTVNAFQAEPAKLDAVFKTNDAGNSWRGIGLPFSQPVIVSVDRSNPQVIYVSNGFFDPWQLFKTIDGGAHWNSIRSGLGSGQPKALVIDPHSSQTLYAGVAGAPSPVYKSIDGGAHWATASNGILGIYVENLTLDPTNSSVLYASIRREVSEGLLYKSTDAGATWNPTALAEIAYQLVIDPNNAATLYAATMQGVLKSTDGGSQWSPFHNGIAPGTEVKALAMDPVNSQTLYAAIAGSTVYKTTDGGAHWTPATAPGRLAFAGTGTVMRPSVFVDPLIHSRIWAAGEEGVFISEDSGVNWRATLFPNSQVSALVADTMGNVYAAALNLGRDDAFVMKLDATGSNIVYSTFLGGIGSDVPQAIAVDNAGRAFVAGTTGSYDFPLASPLQAKFGTKLDIFVTVLDASGSHLVWSTFLGGSDAERGNAISLDSAGDVHLAGAVSPAYLFSNGSEGSPDADALIAKIKGDGSAVLFSRRFGGSDSDIATSVTADTAGNSIVAGTTYSKNLPLAEPVQSTSFGTNSDAFVARFNGQNGDLQFSTYLGGGSNDSAAGLAADAAGNIFVTGQTLSTDFPLKNPWQSFAEPTFRYAFLAKISPSGVNFSGSFSANPNPIPLTAGTLVGKTTITWNAPGFSLLQIKAGGALFAGSLPASGAIDTGNWVSDGMVFALVDSATGQTLGAFTAHTAAASPFSLTASPNPIPLAAGALVGQTTLTWNATGRNALQILVNGKLFAGGLPAGGSLLTGNWVTDGMIFSLVDPSGNQGAGQTLSTIAGRTAGAGAPVTFSASPNPITLAAGQVAAKTTLSWNAPGRAGLQILVPGKLFASGLPSSGSIETGNWVTNRMPFTLIDPAGPASSQILFSLEVAVQAP